MKFIILKIFIFKMDRIDIVRCKIAKIKSLKSIKKLVNDLIKLEYKPHIFINIEDFVVDSSESKSLIFPELKEIVLEMEKTDNIKQLVFLSSRPLECCATFKQLSILLETNQFILLMTSENQFMYILDRHIMTCGNVRFCYKPWFIYLDNSYDRCEKSRVIFEPYNFQYTSCFLDINQSFITSWYNYLTNNNIEIINQF
jgi:hypothetical protein